MAYEPSDEVKKFTKRFIRKYKKALIALADK